MKHFLSLSSTHLKDPMTIEKVTKASGLQTDTLFCHSFPFFAFMHKNLEQTCKFIQTVPETKAKIASLHQDSWLLKIRIYKVHSWVVSI